MDDRPTPAPGGAHRLFFALWPTDEVREALARAVAATPALHGRGRRVAAEKYHLTLHYLGGWPSPPDDVVAQASAVAARIHALAFHLVVDHAGGFRGARVGWLAPAGNSGLDALWSDLRHGLDDARLPYRAHERFSPHITVLREVRGRLDECAVEPVSWPVDGFVLVHSHDGRYDVVGRWPLA